MDLNMVRVVTKSFAVVWMSIMTYSQNKDWRIVYRIDEDRILILEVFNKTTRQTPDKIIKVCRKRLAEYDRARENK